MTDVTSNEGQNRMSYTCTLMPFFDVKSVESDSSYRVSVKLSSAGTYNSSFASALATEILPTLIVVADSPEYHAAMAVSKCIFLPAVVASLAFFLTRSYQNDLYVSIPDRLLISSALALILNNVPFEYIVTNPAASSLWAGRLKLATELLAVGPMVSLALFWSVYTSDKLARNEPWERNTKYYGLSVSSVLFGTAVAVAYVVYTQGPSALNSLLTTWHPETAGDGNWHHLISLSLSFTLAGMALVYQTFLAVMIFRVLCDISVTQSGGASGYFAAGRNNIGNLSVWRIKMVLLYCFAVSVLTAGAFILKLATHMGLYWNHEFYAFPIPLYMSFSSPFLLGMHGE